MATLIAPANSSPVEDAEAIRKAVHGWGADEKKIISIIGHRNAVQRKLIRQTYEETYQEDMIKRFESELHGNFEKAMFRWVLDPFDRDAVLANVALKESNPDYHVIVELSCIYSPEELLAVKRVYQARYHHCLEEDLASHIFGDLGKFLVALAGVYRYDGGEIDPRLAKSEAGVLHNAIKDKNHEEITRIVGTRSKAQLIATFNCYKDEYGASITKHLVNGPANPYSAAVSTAVRCIKDPKKYYEKLLRDALHNHGIDENALTRVIVTRAEKDLKDIKELYYKRNSVTLDHAVAKETSGDYEAFLLTLLGKED
ncbi:annexin-like protein RJ4 [Rhododendron vialii]|uniref:annexin-like protein RJ4 n=1 Tax=Rhododendron vialii TaxID=182163 RepID=UPI00265EE526|nr:annexin-like protein RJ4 [Rhododendron vialii]